VGEMTTEDVATIRAAVGYITASVANDLDSMCTIARDRPCEDLLVAVTGLLVTVLSDAVGELGLTMDAVLELLGQRAAAKEAEGA
jgi:hypothetical protein